MSPSPSSSSAAKRANTRADLREAFITAGVDWATSHAFCTTVATLMDHAGLSSRAAPSLLWWRSLPSVYGGGLSARRTVASALHHYPGNWP